MSLIAILLACAVGLHLPVVPVVDSSPSVQAAAAPGDASQDLHPSRTYQAAGIPAASKGRIRTLALFLLAFVILVLLIGGIQGIKTLFTVAITAGNVIWILLSASIAGHDPIITTVAVCSMVAVLALASIGGASVKTVAAVS